MKTTKSTNTFLNYPFEFLRPGLINSPIPDSIRTIGAQFPALLTVQDCGTMTNVYINEYGCNFLEHSISELLEMGKKYYSNFFPSEEMEVIEKRLKKLVRKNRSDKTISFFQRIRSNERSEYSWFFTTSQIATFHKQLETYLLHISLPVNNCSYMNKRLDSLVEENLFIRKNYHVYNRLTAREKEIIDLISKGNSSRKISDILCISIHTVNNHRKNIIQKIGKEDFFTFLKFNSNFQSNPL